MDISRIFEPVDHIDLAESIIRSAGSFLFLLAGARLLCGAFLIVSGFFEHAVPSMLHLVLFGSGTFYLGPAALLQEQNRRNHSDTLKFPVHWNNRSPVYLKYPCRVRGAVPELPFIYALQSGDTRYPGAQTAAEESVNSRLHPSV